MKSCTFCDIAAGKLPAATIYEDEKVIVLLDLFPVTQGHTLVVSREHSETLAGLSTETPAHLLKVLQATIVALRKADPSICAQNLMINDGPESNQHIPHFHWHIMPRRKGDNLKSLWNFYTRMLNRFGLAKRQQQHQEFADKVREHFSL